MDQEQYWKRITRLFFRRPPKPSSGQTEIFIAVLMDRLDLAAPASKVFPEGVGDGSHPLAAPSPFGARLAAWLESRWLVGALSLGTAALFLYIAQPHPESLAPLDDLVLMDGRDPGAGQLILPPDSKSDENLLATLGEN